MLCRWPLLIGLAALALTACGAPASSPAGDTAQSGGPAQPKPGGVMNIRITNDPYDWDNSYLGKSVPGNWLQSQVGASLLGVKSGPDVRYDEQILRPELAESWEVSPDARTFTFHLRKGLKFQNLPPVNGREITSADVKWSFEYASRTGWAKDQKLPLGQFEWFFEGLESIETPDPLTVVVKFQEPFVPFINYAASDFNTIVAHEVYDQDGHFKDNPAGAGPFYVDLAASQKGTRWSLKKNPNFYDAPRPYIDEVRWLVLPDDSSAVAAFQTKQVDWLEKRSLNPRVVDDIRKTMPSAVVYDYLFPGAYHIYMNVNRAPLDKVEVRKAINLAIDRDEISRTFYGKPYPPAPPGAFNGLFTEEEARKMIYTDVEQAKQLLAKAGYPNGVDLQWEYSRADSTQTVSTLQLIQSQLKQVGINVNLKIFEQSDWSQNRKKHDYTIDLLASTCGGQQDEQDIPLYACYHSGYRSNYGQVADPELDKLLEAQRQEPNVEKRKELQRQAVRRIVDQAWGFDLFYPPQWEVWQPYLKGYGPNVGSKGPNFVNAWVER